MIDRTPPAERHVGADRRWDDTDFRLEMAQKRFEKRLRLSDRLPREVRNGIRADLAAVHSGWANWFLRKKQYTRARQAINEAAKMHLTPLTVAVKWALTQSAPSLVEKVVMMRDESRRRKAFGIG